MKYGPTCGPLVNFLLDNPNIFVQLDHLKAYYYPPAVFCTFSRNRLLQTAEVLLHQLQIRLPFQEKDQTLRQIEFVQGARGCLSGGAGSRVQCLVQLLATCGRVSSSCRLLAVLGSCTLYDRQANGGFLIWSIFLDTLPKLTIHISLYPSFCRFVCSSVLPSSGVSPALQSHLFQLPLSS